MQEDADSSVGDPCEIRNQFSSLRSSLHAAAPDASPLPIAPSDNHEQGSSRALGRVHVMDSARSGTFRILRTCWAQSSLRIPALICAVLCVVTVVMWERSLYDTAHAVHLSGTPPTLIVAAAVICRGAVTGVVLLLVHLCGYAGSVVERTIYCRRTILSISMLQVVSLTLAVFSMAHLEWRHALVFNPATMFPPLCVMLFKAFGKGKSSSWSSIVISVVIVAVCGALAADGLEPSLLARDDETSLSELAFSVVCFMSAVLFALSLVLWERYFFNHPTHPLFAASFCASLEVVLLPAVVLLDVVPGLGFAKDAQSAIASFATLHQRVTDFPASSIFLFLSHTFLGMLVVPFVARCPAAVVLIFCALPLIAAAIFPGGALPVVVGGAYAFFVIMYFFVDDAAYDKSVVTMVSRLCRTVNRQFDTIAWRHGCSVLHWFPRSGAAEPAQEQPPGLSTLYLLGLIPISCSRTGVVTFSARAFASRFANDWRGSYERVPSMNVDE